MVTTGKLITEKIANGSVTFNAAQGGGRENPWKKPLGSNLHFADDAEYKHELYGICQ